MVQKLSNRGLRLLAGASLMMIVGCADLQAQEGQRTCNDGIGKPPYNIVFLIVDQLAYRLLAGPDYSLPGIDAIARHGVTFQNHYISSAMCSPSRASFLTGQPPQVTGVIDQMQYSFVHSLSPGKGLNGPFGSPVFACAGKTEPPCRLILSQTSAGR